MMLEAEPVRRLQMGQASQLEGAEMNGLVRLYDLNQRFLGLGEVQQGGRLVAKRLLATTAKGPAGIAGVQPQAPKNA